MDRRRFVQSLIGGSALSMYGLKHANAGIYQSISKLNKKFMKDNSPDGPYWDAIRDHYFFEDDFIMMNNGTLGPMPKPVFETLMHYFKHQAANPYDGYSYFPQLKDAVRMKIAKFIGADTDEVAVLRNTTEGMNVIASGLKMEAGDEVLLSSQEHPGGTHPWRMRAERYGIKITYAELGAPPKSVDEILTAFEKAITPRTKAISVSHTVYITGLIFPLKELCEIAHKKGIFVVADSAHGFGMLDLNMHDLAIDAFSTSPYKWGGAPTGLGVFYIKKSSQDRVWPLVASSGWDGEGAKRFETLGQRADPLLFALGEAIEFLKRIGIKRIERRIKTMSGYLKQELQKIPKVRLHTPTDPYISAGLTALSMEGIDPQTLVDYVREKYNIVIRTIGRDRDNTRGVRVSTNIYISMNHVDSLLEGFSYIAHRKS